MSRITRLTATLILAATVATPGVARAQEMPEGHPKLGEGGAPHGGASGAPAPTGEIKPILLDAVALDFTAGLQGGHGGDGEHADSVSKIPLADAKIQTLLLAPSGKGKNVNGKTDGDGRLVMDLGDVELGSMIRIQATLGTEAEPRVFYTPDFRIGEEMPPELPFFELSLEPKAVGHAMVMQIATINEVEGREFVQVRHTVRLVNFGFNAYFGYHVPIPDGFEVAEFKIDNVEMPVPELVTLPHGGRGIPYRRPVYPTIGDSQMGHTFFALLRRPFVSGETFDLGGHYDVQTAEYSLSIEKGVMNYVPQDDGQPNTVILQDRGAQAPMGQSQKITHTWVSQRIPPHARIDARVIAGRPSIPITPVLIGIGFLGMIAGVVWLGRAIAGPAEDAAPVGPAGSKEARLADLKGRLDRGEITSFDYQARKRAIQNEGQAAPRGGAPSGGAATAVAAPATAPSPAIGAGIDKVALAALKRELGDIIDREGDSSAEQVAKDVQRVARILKDLLDASS